jgi:hypothetical protein
MRPIAELEDRVFADHNHVTGLWALEAVKRLEVPREGAIGVESVETPEA